MKIYKTLRKRGLALFMSLIMCLSLIPTTAFAAEETDHVHNADGWVCTWVDPVTETACIHTEHDSDCGYVEAAEEVPCDCGAVADDEGNVVHADGCAYKPAVEGQDCTHECGNECLKVVTEGYYICTAPEVEKIDEVPAEVQAFLDAVAELPAAEDVTPDNAVEIGDQVNAVLDMYEALIDAGLDERKDVMEAKAAIDALQAAVKSALEDGSEDEVPAEVKAFLDATDAVLAFGEVTEDNAEEYAVLYEAAMAAYEAVQDAGLDDDEQVVAMLMKLTGEDGGEDGELDSKIMTVEGNDDALQTGLVRSAWSRFYAPQDPGLGSNTYNCVSGNIAETGRGIVVLANAGDSVTDSFVPYFYGNHYTGYPYGYNDNLTSQIHIGDPDIASANVTWDNTGRLNVTITKGSKPGVTNIEIWYNVTMLHVTSGIACDSDTAYAVSGRLVYTVGDEAGMTSDPIEYWVTVDLNPDVTGEDKYVWEVPEDEFDVCVASDDGSTMYRWVEIYTGVYENLYGGVRYEVDDYTWYYRNGTLDNEIVTTPNNLNITSTVHSDDSIAAVTPFVFNENFAQTTSSVDPCGIAFLVEGKQVGQTDVVVKEWHNIDGDAYGYSLVGYTGDFGDWWYAREPLYDRGYWHFDGDISKWNKSYTIHVNVIDTSDGKDITVTYHDGSLTAAETGKAGDEFTIRDALTSKIGHVFKGWATTSNGTAAYTPGQKQVFNTDTDLYAVWEKLEEEVPYKIVREYYDSGTKVAIVEIENLKGEAGTQIIGNDLAASHENWNTYDNKDYTYKSSNPATLTLAKGADNVITLRYERGTPTQPTTYTVYHEYYTNGQRDGSAEDPAVKGTVGDIVKVAEITKNLTYKKGTETYTYTYTRANKGNAVTSGPNAYTLGDVITELELAESGNIIVLRYDRNNVTYDWSGLPDNHGQTLPSGGMYAVGTEVTVDNSRYTKDTEVEVGGTTYVFSGWSTNDATITGGKFTMPAKNVKLTGSWSVKANPGLSVTKTKTENGDTVTYTITVTNTGNVTLYNPMLVDTMEKVLTPTDPRMASVNVTVTGNDGNTGVTLLGVRDDVKAPQRNSAGYITWDEQGGLTRTTGGDDMWDFTWMLEGAFKVGATMTLSYSATINYPENADTVTYKNWADAIAGTSEDDVPKYDGGISTFSFVSGGSGAVGSGSGEVVGQQVKYTLTYDFDGGTWNGNSSYTVEQWSTIGSYTFKVDGTVQPTKDGCTFQNQWTKTGTTLTAGADVVATTENKHVTIKAVWTDNPVVTFNPNGGNWNNSTDPKKVPTDTDDKVTPPADPEQTNKVFDGWYTEQTGGTRVDFTTKTFGQDTTVYAHWEDDNWTDPKNDQNGGKPGDGISDKYQVKIVYAADENGKIADGAKTEEVFTLGTEGNYLTSGNVTISGSTAEANSRYYFKDWTSTRSVYTNLDKEDASLAGKELSVQGGTTYTFTANFEAKIELKIKNVGNGETVTYDGKEHTVTGYTMTVWDKDDKEITLPAGLIVTPASEDCVVKGTEARRSLYTMGLHVNDFQLTGPDAYKYYVSDWTVIDGWLKINPPETVLDVTASSVETTYDGQEHPIDPANIQVTVDGTPVNDATVTIAYVDENNQPITGAPKDAGTYTATITATKDGKSVSTTTTVTILKRNLTVTTDSASKTYDGTALTAPGRIGGLVDGETVTFTVTGSQTAAGNSVNIYTLIWNGTAKESNYDVTSVNRGTLTVNRRTLTVTTGSASKRYDGRPLTDSTITITGQAPGESITGVTTGSQTRVGSSYNTYTLTWGAGVLGSNYRIEENLGTLRVRDYTGGGAGGGTGGDGGTTTTPPTATIPDTTTPFDPGTSIDDQDVPLAGTVGLNDTDHFAYIIGRDEDHVYPLSNITRAEVATIFFRLMTEDFRVANWSTTNSFTDVKGGDWYNNAISTCANAGILKGREDGRFDPNASITRAEFAAIAARFLNDSYTDDGTGDFADTADHWAAKEIRLAAKAGWIYGNGNSFNPESRITRAEVMTIVNRMLDRTPDKDHMLPEMKKWADCPEDAWYYEAVQEATNEHDYTRDETSVETWTALKEGTDWAALELGWAANNGASAPAAETETETETQSLPDGI